MKADPAELEGQFLGDRDKITSNTRMAWKNKYTLKTQHGMEPKNDII